MSTELDSSIQDVQRTGTVLTTAQWSVASVVMAGSAYSAGLAFQYFHEQFAVGVITGLGVDFALASWLLIARRLRDSGVHAQWGQILEGLTALMTLCLNAGTSVLQHKYLLAGFHTFLPIVLFVLSMAGGEAHQKLRRKMKEKEAQETAAREAANALIRARQAADQSRAHEQKVSDNNTRIAEATDRTRRAELVNEQGKRESKDKAAAREARVQESTNILAAALLWSTSLRVARHQNALARMASVLLMSVTAKGFPKRRASRSRQTTSPASPARVANGSPVRRQAPSPTGRRPRAMTSQQAGADKPDVVRLAKQAAVVLENNPGIGRGQLAAELGVSPHYARLALDQLKAEKDAARDAEIASLLNGAPAPRNPSEDTRG